MIDWDNINTVFLDLDGTLLDLGFDNYFWQEFVPLRYAQSNALALETAKSFVVSQYQAMEGRLEWYCVDYWSEKLGLDISGLKAEISDSIAILPHAQEFLQAANNSQKRLLLITNCHPKSLTIKMAKTRISDFFEALVNAHELGLAKEQAGFWDELNRLKPFDQKRTLFVDDSLTVLRNAQDYGFDNLISISKPDSRLPSRIIREFPSITDFRQLMPVC